MTVNSELFQQFIKHKETWGHTALWLGVRKPRGPRVAPKASRAALKDRGLNRWGLTNSAVTAPLKLGSGRVGGLGTQRRGWLGWAAAPGCLRRELSLEHLGGSARPVPLSLWKGVMTARPRGRTALVSTTLGEHS